MLSMNSSSNIDRNCYKCGVQGWLHSFTPDPESVGGLTLFPMDLDAERSRRTEQVGVGRSGHDLKEIFGNHVLAYLPATFTENLPSRKGSLPDQRPSLLRCCCIVVLLALCCP
jgi:hypothetical protein